MLPTSFLTGGNMVYIFDDPIYIKDVNDVRKDDPTGFDYTGNRIAGKVIVTTTTPNQNTIRLAKRSGITIVVGKVVELDG